MLLYGEAWFGKSMAYKTGIAMKKWIDKWVYVEWIDASSPPGDATWHSPFDLKGWIERRYIIKDAGYVMEQDRDYIVLVGGYGDQNEHEYACFHREVKIPWSAVKLIKDLTSVIAPKKQHARGRG